MQIRAPRGTGLTSSTLYILSSAHVSASLPPIKVFCQPGGSHFIFLDLKSSSHLQKASKLIWLRPVPPGIALGVDWSKAFHTTKNPVPFLASSSSYFLRPGFAIALEPADKLHTRMVSFSFRLVALLVQLLCESRRNQSPTSRSRPP